MLRLGNTFLRKDLILALDQVVKNVTYKRQVIQIHEHLRTHTLHKVQETG